MQQNFDYFDVAEPPSFTLCNPNKVEIYSLDMAYDRSLKLKYNAISELEFRIPKSVDNVNTLAVYDYVKSKRLVLVDGIGYFVIVTVSEDHDGAVPVKSVSCKSYEYNLATKRLAVFSGTVKFYDLSEPEDSMLGRIITLSPGWTVGTVDIDLIDKYRTFDVNDTSIYNFLVKDCEEAYNCVFIFDTVNFTISASAVENIVDETDVYLSFNNFLKDGSFEEISDEICTCLYCYGAGNLDIRSVNPLGSTAIYNFDYYKSTDWMSQSLIDALDLWESKVDVYINPTYHIYADLLSALKTSLGELIELEGIDAELQAEYLALEAVQKARIEAGLSYSEITTAMNAKLVEISNNNLAILAKETQITQQRLYLTSIHDDLDLENPVNFTVDQLAELNDFIFENTYQNENIIQTDSMSSVQIQDQAQTLYDQSQTVLEKLSQPRYEFSVDSANILFLKDQYANFGSQLQLGSSLWVELEEDRTIRAVLLEIDLNYDKPEDFSMTFSNRLRLDGSDFIFSDLFGQVIKTGSSVSFGKLNWENWENDYKDDVSLFITSALDASRNAVINATNQEILINQNGLRGRKVIDPDATPVTYEDAQVWLTSSVLAFTDNNWQTAKAALGRIALGDQYYYGLCADAVVGKMIAGNKLQITNASGPNGEIVNFVLDGNGAVLTNADFTINSTSVQNVIKLNSGDGISITRTGDNVKTFSIDTLGNLSIIGKITATSGLIGSWGIDNYGLSQIVYSTSGDVENYIKVKPTGPAGRLQTYVKLGDLTLEPGNMNFAGTIYANKIDGQLTRNQIVDIVAEQVKAGNMSLASNGTGGGSGYISWGNNAIKISETGTGSMDISSSVTLAIRNGLNVINFSSTGVIITTNGSNITFGASGSGKFVCQRSASFQGGVSFSGAISVPSITTTNVGSIMNGCTFTNSVGFNSWATFSNRIYIDSGASMYVNGAAIAQSEDILVGAGYSDKKLKFRKGICIGYDVV